MRDETHRMSVFPSVVSDLVGTDHGTPFRPSDQKARGDLVLLVEDDDILAEIVVHILSRIVPRVIRAKDGTEAAQLFAENESEISLIMLDCCLPDIDGVALCRVLRRIAPDLPVILTSGWDHPDAKSLTQQGPTVFLAKPFLPSQIEQHVKALLGTTT